MNCPIECIDNISAITESEELTTFEQLVEIKKLIKEFYTEEED